MNGVAIVGGSLAGVCSARALRHQGYEGRVTIVAAEEGAPYDRPPLSKEFLAGTVAEGELALLGDTLPGDDEDLALDWRAGITATALRTADRAIELSDGTDLVVDLVVAASGARPRQPWPALPPGAQVLRTLADARRLRAALLPGARLVVVGAGFIGSEVASTARSLGVEVTVVEAASEPLRGPLGAQLGAVVSGLHAEHGVHLVTGVGVTEVLGAHHAEGVALSDGRTIGADVVLLGVGVQPNVEWLRGCGLAGPEGVRCDAWGATSVATVVGVGDCAAWFDQGLGAHHRVEHWTAARERAGIAVTTLLSGGAVRTASRPPYVWSDQYGIRLQLAGHTRDADSVTIEEGSVDERDFLAVYRRAGAPVAVLALGRARSFMRWRKNLAAAATEAVTTRGGTELAGRPGA